MTARTLQPFDPSKVAPFRLGAGRRGALLLHGFASTPPELRRLGEHLAARGWRCHAPALAGHGATPEALEATSWRDWAASAQAALDELAAECDLVVVCGQSMGGTMALHLAATDLRVRAVVTLAALLHLNRSAHHLLPVVIPFKRWYIAGDDIDLWDPRAVDELYSYGRRAMRSVRELDRFIGTVSRELAQVRAPVLVVHGGRDRTVNPCNAGDIVARLVNSQTVERVLLPRSGHAVSVDIDREEVNRLATAWFERFSDAAAPTAVMESASR